jgi:acetate kinase
MKIAVINSGSSSIKYKIIDTRGPRVCAAGLIEKIGEPEARVVLDVAGGEGSPARHESFRSVPDHEAGFAVLLELLSGIGPLDAFGHRVVHGGEVFRAPVAVDASIVEAIRDHEPLAPLHNPANRAGIEAAMAACPGVPQVAVFDTAFHQSMPAKAYRYALPEELYARYRVRRYGFHGTSCAFVSARAAEFLGLQANQLNAVILHLGNGASATAVRGGRSVDTSMGLTPLEGLVMGTRSGDVDPALHAYLGRTAGLGLEAIDGLLNRDSGLKGLCGENDMRTIIAAREEGNAAASLAFDVFCYRARKYVGAYLAALGRTNALVFTGGIGENVPEVRAAIAAGLDALGLRLDPERNAITGPLPADIAAADSPVRILVLQTDEELEIALQTARILGATETRV